MSSLTGSGSRADKRGSPSDGFWKGHIAITEKLAMFIHQCHSKLGTHTSQDRHKLYRDDGAHAVTYELGWRKLEDPSRHASRAVRQQLGDSLKSSIAYTCRYETFADPLLPYDGFGVRCAPFCSRSASPATHEPFNQVGMKYMGFVSSCDRLLSCCARLIPYVLTLRTAVVQVYNRACRHRAGRFPPPLRQAAYAGGLCLAAGWLVRFLTWCAAHDCIYPADSFPNLSLWSLCLEL